MGFSLQEGSLNYSGHQQVDFERDANCTECCNLSRSNKVLASKRIKINRRDPKICLCVFSSDGHVH